VRVRLNVLLTPVALAAALTACGGGVSKADFTSKADGACGTGNGTISAVAKPSNAPQVATGAGTAATTIDAQVTTLRGMKLPGGDDKRTIDGIIAAIGEVSGPTKALQEAAGKNDDAAMAKASIEMQTKADAAATQAQAYGMTQCGTGLKPALANLVEGTKSVVKGAYVSKAEKLCSDALARMERIAAPGSSLASNGRYLDAVIGISAKLATDLRALPAPPGDEGTVNELLAAFDNLNAKGREMATAAKANNARLVIALEEEVSVASTAANAKLDAYGLTSCGSAAG
jgi:hypothetical protein